MLDPRVYFKLLVDSVIVVRTHTKVPTHTTYATFTTYTTYTSYPCTYTYTTHPPISLPLKIFLSLPPPPPVILPISSSTDLANSPVQIIHHPSHRAGHRLASKTLVLYWPSLSAFLAYHTFSRSLTGPVATYSEQSGLLILGVPAARNSNTYLTI